MLQASLTLSAVPTSPKSEWIPFPHLPGVRVHTWMAGRTYISPLLHVSVHTRIVMAST